MKKSKRGITPLKWLKGWLKLSALAAVLAAQTALGGMTSYGVVYVYEDDEEDEDEDWLPIRRSSSTGRSTQTENGPGSDEETRSEMETNTVILNDPLVNQVTLSERYHEDYQVYEESLADLFFFYSNVGNGGITHETVYLDIPQNLSYTIELNGVPWDYLPGQPISSYGTYVVRLKGIEDTTAPLYEQKEYQAVFRFRIQQKPPEEETKESSESAAEAGAPGGMEWHSYTYDGKPLEDTQAAQEVFQVRGSEEHGEKENDEKDPENALNPEETLFAEEGLSAEESREEPENEDITGENYGENQEETSSESDEESAERPGVHTGFVPRTQSYDPGSQRYHVSFPDGLELVSNVPEGYMGPDAVELSVSPAGRENLVLYRDDEVIDYVHGDSLTQPGHYRLEVNGQPWFCTIASWVKESGVYAAPSGMHFASALLDGEVLALPSDRYVEWEEDGTYQFVLEGENGAVLTTSLTKDSEAPQVEVKVKGGNASIQYLSEDIEEIRLEKDGKWIEGFSGYSVSRPGSYRLTVRDKAGNEAQYSFNLTYRVNRYGIIVVVMVILLIAGGVAFVIHTKRSVKIR